MPYCTSRDHSPHQFHDRPAQKLAAGTRSSDHVSVKVSSMFSLSPLRGATVTLMWRWLQEPINAHPQWSCYGSGLCLFSRHPITMCSPIHWCAWELQMQVTRSVGGACRKRAFIACANWKHQLNTCQSLQYTCDSSCLCMSLSLHDHVSPWTATSPTPLHFHLLSLQEWCLK